MSVFFVKIVLVAVGAEKDVRHPVRRSAHLLTDHIQVNIRAAFDDQLIMNVTDDEAVPESLHGVAEDVAADMQIPVKRSEFSEMNGMSVPM